MWETGPVPDGPPTPDVPKRLSRFKPFQSPGLPPDKWHKSALSRAGLREMYIGKDSTIRPFPVVVKRIDSQSTYLSAVGYELYVIGTVATKDDPVHAMAETALENWCGVSYGALLDLLEEDGTFPCDDFVPSRFAALLIRSQLTGVEADQIMAEWSAQRRGWDRMVKALNQGVSVSDRLVDQAGRPLIPHGKQVRVRSRPRVIVGV